MEDVRRLPVGEDTEEITLALDELAREGARRMIAAALRAEADEYVERVFLFAPLHDVGKIGIPDAILLKPGPLDEDELAVVREHPTLGVRQALGKRHAYTSAQCRGEPS